MEIVIGLTISLVSFLTTYFLTKKWIKVAKVFGLVGKDMNKYKKKLIPEGGGIAVILAISFSLLVYIFFKTFYWKTVTHLVETFAIISTVLLAGFIGFVDDILGWKRGLKRWQKPLLTVPITIPLMVINVGHSVMNIPFFGSVDLGLFYPLVLVPIGVVGAANGFNMLAGYNGLEVGIGAMIFAAFGFLSFSTSQYWLALLCVVILVSLIAFLIFNWYPGRIFPGNSFTYSMGALVAAIAILGNMEKIAIWLFIPYFMDAILYLRALIDRKRGVQAFAKPNRNGSLELPYKKIYDTTHVVIYFLKRIKRKVYEKDVVYFLMFVELLLIITGLWWLV